MIPVTNDLGPLQKAAVDNEDGVDRGKHEGIVGRLVRSQINNPSPVVTIAAWSKRQQNPADERLKVIGVFVVALCGEWAPAMAMLPRMVVAVHREMDRRPPKSPYGGGEFPSERGLPTGSRSVNGYSRWVIERITAYDFSQLGDGVASCWIHCEPFFVNLRRMVIQTVTECLPVESG